MIGGRFKNGLLRLNPIYVLIFVEHLLLDNFYGVDLLSFLMFCLNNLKNRNESTAIEI